MENAIIKKRFLTAGNMNGITGTEAITTISSALMPKILKIEYTVSMYAAIAPKIISIHAASLVFGQRIIAKKAAAAPKTS